MIWNITPSSSI